MIDAMCDTSPFCDCSVCLRAGTLTRQLPTHDFGPILCACSMCLNAGNSTSLPVCHVCHLPIHQQLHSSLMCACVQMLPHPSLYVQHGPTSLIMFVHADTFMVTPLLCTMHASQCISIVASILEASGGASEK